MKSKGLSGFVRLLEENKGIIYKIARSYCRNSDDEQDLVQEISIQLWNSFERFNGSVKFSTWVYRVALNVAISHYRKDIRRKTTLAPLSNEIIEMTHENRLDDDIENQLKLLEHFIKNLNELDRALVLLYLEEKSQKEIAEILGLSISNVSTRVGRIKEKLKQQFDSHK